MTKHHGEAVLQQIRKLQRRELLQRRCSVDPTKEKIMYDPNLSALVANLHELDGILADRRASGAAAAEISSFVAIAEEAMPTPQTSPRRCPMTMKTTFTMMMMKRRTNHG
jgi:hypothetical protein